MSARRAIGSGIAVMFCAMVACSTVRTKPDAERPPSPRPAPDPVEAASAIVEDQLAIGTWEVTARFSPVRADLGSGDDRRVEAGLKIVDRIGVLASKHLHPYMDDNLGTGVSPLISDIAEVLDRLRRTASCAVFIDVERTIAGFPCGHMHEDVRAHYHDCPTRPEDSPLSKRVLVCRMNTITNDIAGCFARDRPPGTVMVNVNIAPQGHVTATATGTFAGTPAGTCVENAVKTLSFPPSQGLTTPYPFTLR